MMEDGLIEIDPELYMKCRLCIEEKGKFQIPPKLQERIKYAFDIDVHLFDGFSQIMCEKCKTIVTDYCAVKEQFQAKQKELLARASNPPQQANTENEEAVINSSNVCEQSDSEENISKKKKSKKTRKKILSPTSSSDEDIIQPLSPADSVKSLNSPLVIEESEPESALSSWKDLYKRSYVCRYCDKNLTFENSMKDHVRSHNSLRRKKRQLTKWHSTVQIERFEDHPNLTGNNDIVVVSPTQLITNSNNPDFYVVYTPAGLYGKAPPKYISTDSKDITSDSDHNDQITKKRFTCEDVTSDEDEQPHRPKLRKRIRLQSTLSVDTVDLQADISEAPNEGSSDIVSQNIPKDTDSEAVTKSKTQKSKAIRNEYETIKQIIAASLENEKKKLGNVGGSQMNDIKKKPDADDILKRKLLSIGRKVMVKQGFSSMGLLKFLEQRNLNIQWTDPTKNANSKLSGKDSTYVRIQTKLMESLEPDHLTSFVPCIDTFNAQNETVAEHKLRINSYAHKKKMLKKENAVESAKITPTDKNTPLPVIMGPQISSNTQVLLPPTNIPSILATSVPLLPPTNVPVLPASSVPLLPALPNTTLIKTSGLPISVTGQPSDSAKYTQFQVLNASPVANPKKAIKKKTNDTFSNQIQQNNTPSVSPNVSTDHNYNSTFISLDSDDEEPPHEAPDAASNLNGITTNSPVQPQANLSYTSGDTIVHSNSHIIMNPQGLCMPIITSTESLANIVKEEPVKKDKVDQSNNNKVPRIKCKPVSELMAGKNEPVPYSQAQLNKSINNSIQLSNGNLEILPLQTSEEVKNEVQIDSKSIQPGHVVLHTITLPYTVTNSPFEYFSKLLRMHILFLFYSPPKPSELDFVNLVKFRLGVHQHPVSVMLCLSLDTCGSSFYITVKNKSNEDVHVNTMSALWQWEVLRAFNSESVITKIRQAAEKEQAANLTFTNLFLSLLGSIQLVSESDGQGPSKAL